MIVDKMTEPAQRRLERLKLVAEVKAYLEKRVKESAIEVHALLRIGEPTGKELKRYRNAVMLLSHLPDCRKTDNELIMEIAVVPFVESLLRRIRSTGVALGRTSKANKCFKAEIMSEMLKQAGEYRYSRVCKNYRRLAKAISKVISENVLSLMLNVRAKNMQILVAHLSEHLMAETALAVESGFARPGFNLRRNSVFEIQSVIDNLERYKCKEVSENAHAIVGAALRRENLQYVTEILRTEYGQ
jgi:hypothetical protein